MSEPNGAAEPVFIDFEGIDGSGKTSLSNHLADYLRQCGVPVHHARDKGVFRSEISKAIRTLTRDPRFLRMSDVTEFLLYTARDCQMIDEFIRPKLTPGNVVFSDRYLHSAITHSHHARGIDREHVEAVLEVAARGLWPDLVVYCDVDPLTSRLRKKIQKIKDRRPPGDFGRKGLMGIGFREKMRDGFHELAREDLDRWLVIDNANSTFEESLQRIFDRVKEVLRRKGYGDIPSPEWADVSAGKERVASSVETSVDQLLAIPDDDDRRKAAIGPTFFAELEKMVEGRAAFTALYISGIDSPESTALREHIWKEEPAVVAHGLQGVRSPESIELREKLAETEPLYVARSLGGMMLDPRACALRRELAEVVPAQIALAIKGSDSEHAWELRKLIGKNAAREVLLSVAGLDTEAAWALREKRAKERYFPALLESLAGIDSDEAWEWRTKLYEEYLPWVLISLKGLGSDRAWAMRAEHIHRAPKIIIKGLGRSSDPRAWELRQAAKLYAKEVLDSLSGLDDSVAWSLRHELCEKWPNTSVSSLGAGSQSERAWKFRWEMLAKHRENLLLLKHLFKAAQRAFAEEFAIDDDDDYDDDL